MSAALALLARDVKLPFREGGAIGTALGFYLVVVAITPLGLGPDLNLLARIAAGQLWVALLLAAILSADLIFHNDYEDGGSSSSQIGRGAAKRRDSASLRFCPADKRPAGRPAREVSPKAASARLSPAPSPFRKSAQKARFSLTLKLAFTALAWPT